MDIVGFDVGDTVMLLNADEIEERAGRDVSTCCTWHHSNVTSRAGQLACVDQILDDTYYPSFGTYRHCIQVITEDGEAIFCHPEWAQLLHKPSEDSSALDVMFAEFST